MTPLSNPVARRALLIAALLASSCTASLPIDPQIVGYSCCNLRDYSGWISSNNVQGGTLVPVGEPVRLTSIRRNYYLYGTIRDAEVGFRDDAAKNAADTLAWARQIVVAANPREEIAGWPNEIRVAIAAGKVVLGMTRQQVIVSLGHPSILDTADLNSNTWRYWTAQKDLPVDIRFDADGKLASLSGDPAAVRIIQWAL